MNLSVFGNLRLFRSKIIPCTTIIKKYAKGNKNSINKRKEVTIKTNNENGNAVQNYNYNANKNLNGYKIVMKETKKFENKTDIKINCLNIIDVYDIIAMMVNVTQMINVT